jgi:hypothetical protein
VQKFFDPAEERENRAGRHGEVLYPCSREGGAISYSRLNIVMASIFRDDRRSPDGSAAPAGGSKLSTNGLPRMYLPRTAGPNTASELRSRAARLRPPMKIAQAPRPSQRELVSTFRIKSLDPRKKNTV